MAVLGLIMALLLALLSLAATGLMLWSGWLAYRNELHPGFKTRPPGPRSISLTLLGFAFPVLLIGAFTLYLAFALVRMGFNAL
jgi:hypothetical protein